MHIGSTASAMSAEKQSATHEILEQQKAYLWPSHMLYYREPVVLDHGAGSWVTDVEGTRYLDYFGGILTTSVGHNHPKLVDKVSGQVGRIIHSSTLYPHANHVGLAKKMHKSHQADCRGPISPTRAPRRISWQSWQPAATPVIMRCSPFAMPTAAIRRWGKP